MIAAKADPAEEIIADSVARLQPVLPFRTGSAGAHTATPQADGGMAIIGHIRSQPSPWRKACGAVRLLAAA
jgi:hypothetical protein